MTTDDEVPLVFVVGAGANTEVGLPMGDGLKKMIADALSFQTDRGNRMTGGNATIHETLYQLAGRQSERINHYLAAARLVKNGMPQAPSIDNFLDVHRDNKYVEEVGKLAIASCILSAETTSSMRVDTTNIYNTIEFGNISSTWFNALFQILTLNCQPENLAERLSKVRIITFNYDRCIEHYLHSSFCNYHGLTEERATEVISGLQIYHSYGSLGPLPWTRNNESVAFGASLPSRGLISVSGRLRTFTEGTDEESSEVIQIRRTMRRARLTVFLGFSYHDLNLRLLYGERPNASPVRRDRRIIGSAFKMSRSNTDVSRADLSRLSGIDPSNIILEDLEASPVMAAFSKIIGKALS
jgi:hypothetical protein